MSPLGQEFLSLMSPLSRLMCQKGRPGALMLLTWAAVLTPARAQEITIQNESNAPVKVTAGEIAAMTHQKVSVDEHGKTVTYEGLPLRLVLEKAGVTFGNNMRGKRLSTCLLVEASDGYRVVFALPELDPAFTDQVILLADRADGHPLDNKEGPFRIVIPGEKRMARWVSSH